MNPTETRVDRPAPVPHPARRVATAVLLLAIAGCASSGPKRSALTVETMNDAHAALTKERKQIDRTLAALSKAVSAEPDRLRKDFDAFSSEVDEFNSDAEGSKKLLVKLGKDKRAYLAAWEDAREDVRDPELRRVSEARNAEVGASLDRAVASLRAAIDESKVLLVSLRDVRKVLGNDLTASGQMAVSGSDVVRNADERGRRASDRIGDALVEIETVARHLSSTGSMN